MKTYLMATVVALSMSSVLFSQDSTAVKKRTFDFGARVGTSIYSIKTQNDLVEETGLYVGLFVEKQLSNSLALQIEANYSGMSVLQLPVLLKYKITNKFEVYAGGSLDFSFEQKNVLESLRNKRWGSSLILGGQYNINSHWFVEGRYIHGLTDQFPVYQGANTPSLFGNKRSFNLGIGYKF